MQVSGENKELFLSPNTMIIEVEGVVDDFVPGRHFVTRESHYVGAWSNHQLISSCVSKHIQGKIFFYGYHFLPTNWTVRKENLRCCIDGGVKNTFTLNVNITALSEGQNTSLQRK